MTRRAPRRRSQRPPSLRVSSGRRRIVCLGWPILGYYSRRVRRGGNRHWRNVGLVRRDVCRNEPFVALRAAPERPFHLHARSHPARRTAISSRRKRVRLVKTMVLHLPVQPRCNVGVNPFSVPPWNELQFARTSGPKIWKFFWGRYFPSIRGLFCPQMLSNQWARAGRFRRGPVIRYSCCR